MSGITRMLTACLGLSVLALLGACTTNPTTGRSQFTLLSVEDEIALGAQSKPELVQEFGGEVEREDVKRYVRDIGMKLAQTTQADDPNLAKLPWEFIVLDSDVINAFALPGGKVFISRGLLSMMTNEAQMAGVLGHEIGHVMARHTNERFSRAAGVQVGLGIGAAFLGGGVSGRIITSLAGQATQIALMKYDRSQESESDVLGVRYMTRLNYNPTGQVQVMDVLKAAAGDSVPPEILSTHPDPGRRAEDLRKLIADKYPETQNNPQFVFKENEYKAAVLKKLATAYPNAGEPRLADAGTHVPSGAMGVLGAACGGCK